MILCGDRIDGKYWRLERPVTHRNTYDIWASYSTDLIHWGEAELLLGVEDVPLATFKIGAAAAFFHFSESLHIQSFGKLTDEFAVA